MCLGYQRWLWEPFMVHRFAPSSPSATARVEAVQLDHVLGLDLGQAQDFSALALLERRWVQHEESRRWEIHFALRYLHRWPLKTSYPRIVADVCDLVQRPPLRNPLLAVDQTGVGRAVLDILRQAGPQARVRPILITAGHEVTQDEEGVGTSPRRSWPPPSRPSCSSAV
jgi:hypothetical protein